MVIAVLALIGLLVSAILTTLLFVASLLDVCRKQ